MSSTAAPRHALFARFYRGLWRAAVRITASDRTWLCCSEIKTLNLHTQVRCPLTRRRRDRAKYLALLSQPAGYSDGSLSRSAGCRPVDFQQWSLVPVLLETIKITIVSKRHTLPTGWSPMRELILRSTAWWLERWLLRCEVTVFPGSGDSISPSFSGSAQQLSPLTLAESKSDTEMWKVWFGFLGYY